MLYKDLLTKTVKELHSELVRVKKEIQDTRKLMMKNELKGNVHAVSLLRKDVARIKQALEVVRKQEVKQVKPVKVVKKTKVVKTKKAK